MKKQKKIWICSFLIMGLVLILTYSCKKDNKLIPVLTTSAVSNITATTATCGGNITDDKGSTIITRGVCWSTEATPTIADNITTDGAGAGSFTSNIIGLFGGTTYYVRAYATNSAGTGYGMAMSFKTTGQPPSAPTSTTQDAASIQISSAQLNGVVNANYFSTTVTFEYGTTVSYGSKITATQSPVTGGTNTNVSANITGLTLGTTYHYRIKAVNSLGTTYSNDITFTTLGQVPTVKTLAATNTTLVGTQLNGSVNANFLEAIVTFEYGTTISYGSTITATQSPVTGGTNTNVSANITGLTLGTTYHYRIKTVNSLGTTYSNDITFTTLGQVPTVKTLAATSITPVAAQLNGSVNANFLESTVTFEYGTTISYGSTITATQSPVTGGTNTNVSANITGLTKLTIYHYRIKAVNSLGTTYSNDITFIYLYYGAFYQGGYVFYIDGTGQHGLVCAPDNQGSGIEWGCNATDITGADGIDVGTGNQNTIDIVNGCSTAGIAAKICYDLDLNGYTDWFLPSKKELGFMYTNLNWNNLIGYAYFYYWSSTEFSKYAAWHQNFINGVQDFDGKNNPAFVRAVRSF